jgi:uncharacterized membrane protein YkvA (DUF1232 family)
VTPPRDRADSEDDRFQDPHFRAASRRPRAAASDARPDTMSARRAGAKRTLLDTVRQIPHYLRLLGGLVRDRRVSLLDKALVAGAIAYIVSPIDLIPDFIPFLGQVDDVFLLMASLERLVANAGEDVLHDHWHGESGELDTLNFKEVLGAATMLLPGGIKSKLVRLVRHRGREVRVSARPRRRPPGGLEGPRRPAYLPPWRPPRFPPRTPPSRATARRPTTPRAPTRAAGFRVPRGRTARRPTAARRPPR